MLDLSALEMKLITIFKSKLRGAWPNMWILGFIYFNPMDKRFLPPKRFNHGVTINFGNLYAWAVIVLFVVLVWIGL